LAGGHEVVVQLLLEKNADVHAQGRLYSNVLQVASSHGNRAVVQLLLKKDTDINVQGGEYDSTL